MRASFDGDLQVYLVAIAGDNAVDLLAQEGGQAEDTAPGVDGEDRHGRGGGRPQPTPLALQLPTGWVGELHVGLPCCLACLVMRRRQRSAWIVFLVIGLSALRGFCDGGVGELLELVFRRAGNSTSCHSNSGMRASRSLHPG
jgi:hypothetical protein